MKTAIFTIAIGDEFSQLAKVSHPRMKEYAKRIGADFIVCDDIGKSMFPHFRKFQIRELFESGYDRLMFIDTDILIKSTAANLFDLVPEDHIGMYDEINMPFLQRNGKIDIWLKNYLKAYNKLLKSTGRPVCKPPDDWGTFYYNTGVIVCSKSTDIFDPPLFEFKSHGIHDQNYINLLVAMKNVKMFNLPKEFNYRFIEANSVENGIFIHFNGVSNRVKKMRNLSKKLSQKGL